MSEKKKELKGKIKYLRKRVKSLKVEIEGKEKLLKELEKNPEQFCQFRDCFEKIYAISDDEDKIRYCKGHYETFKDLLVRKIEKEPKKEIQIIKEGGKIIEEIKWEIIGDE